MTRPHLAAVALGSMLACAPASAAPTRSSPLAVAPDGHVFVVNPDSSTVARLEFDPAHVGVRTHEQPVGAYPRTLALAGAYVFTADQNGDTVSRLSQIDLGGRIGADLGVGCNPYGVAATPDGSRIVVACQGTSEVVILDVDLELVARVALAWPNARALAITSDGAKAYVSHYLSEEPDNDAHVSVVDIANKSVRTVFALPPDTTTCETQNSGQGPLNLISAIALVPDGAPPEVAGQVWLGGTQQNNLSKGLFKRETSFTGEPGAGLFPWLTFRPFPDGGANRNIYKASFHDITRFGIYKLDAENGAVVGKLDVDEANNATDIEFSADGTTAYVVDLMFNSYHVFNTRKGQGADVTTLFGKPSARGPGGADPSAPCVPNALDPITGEEPFRMPPQAQITVIDSFEPVDPTNTVVKTGLDFNTKQYMAQGVSEMRPVADGVGTAPIGVRLAPDGQSAYVANYLARNVVAVATAAPLDAAGRPANLRCVEQGRPGNPGPTCATNNDCGSPVGFCNHPGGASCRTDADCAGNPPCIVGEDCVPLVLGLPVPTTASDPVPAAVLDGKILFNTAARDASVSNGAGLRTAAPRFNDASDPENALTPGSVVSTAALGSYVSCSACHADFGGQDGRTWDFSQFGTSLRNTIDLRGRPGFSPGTCDDDASRACFFDAGCGDGHFCTMNPQMVPPNVQGADRDRYFNPMLTVHWNGDRDEVEDFEHTFRSLLGSGDCDGAEDISLCGGALIQRSAATSTDPADVNDDLGSPNRNIRGPTTGKVVGIRLTHLADFVYSLTEFVRNPNQPSEASSRGRRLFDDPQLRCVSCHTGGPRPDRQFFTDKKPNPDFDPSQPGDAERNNPFLRHDVGTGNLFDSTDPRTIAMAAQNFQNPRVPIPGDRGTLVDYVTPVLNDVWNTAPYLHDGSAHTLLDVIRPCDTTVDRDHCLKAGRGRNLDGRHGVTAILTPQQLNDLVAFLKTLTLAAVVGPDESIVTAGVLDLHRARLRFPRSPQHRCARAHAKGAFALAGVVRGARGIVDPGGNATLSIATPGGEAMRIRSWSLPMKRRANGTRFSGVSTESGGRVILRLRELRRGGFRFAARGRKLDLSSLDTGNRDLTVAIEMSGTQFVKNYNLTGRRNVFRLRRRRAGA